MNVAGIINRHLPSDTQAEFEHGSVLSLLIAARLYSPVALINVAGWAGESGADILWDIPVEKITDDRLGKSLDAFFTQRHSILASLALHVSHEFSIPLSELHYDPTHTRVATGASRLQDYTMIWGRPAQQGIARYVASRTPPALDSHVVPLDSRFRPELFAFDEGDVGHSNRWHSHCRIGRLPFHLAWRSVVRIGAP